MADRMKQIREKSKKRKHLLAQAFGVGGLGGLRDVLGNKGDKKVSSGLSSPTARRLSNSKKSSDVAAFEDEVYTDSSTFLKGLQSANPHNDYNQNFVDIGERPQNYIRDVGLQHRFEEYPKLRELMRLKDNLVHDTNPPPMYLATNLETFDLRTLRCQFDVILLEPPLEEYHKQFGVVFDKYWNWNEIESLDIPSVAAQRSFIWIWCGNDQGLERGRQCLKKWGYRRCEDICWIKTNTKKPGQKIIAPDGIFQRTKEHCLMGIKGTVKRSTDGDFIHANVDIDLIIEEEPEYGCQDKPEEIFYIIEHFCLGRRRLHLFGRDSTVRNGWLTVGPELTSSSFDVDKYLSNFNTPESYLTGCPDDVERLRPKSPTLPGVGVTDRGRGGRGRGDNRGRGDGRGLGRGDDCFTPQTRGTFPGRGMRSRGMRGPGYFRSRGSPLPYRNPDT